MRSYVIESDMAPMVMTSHLSMYPMLTMTVGQQLHALTGVLSLGPSDKDLVEHSSIEA